MTIAAFTLHGDKERQKVAELAATADPLTRVTFAEPKRSDAQNDAMWAKIADVMKQKPDWFAPGLDKDDVKQVFMSGMMRELRMARNPDGDGYIPIAHRSSRLSRREMSDLLEYISAWGARNGVRFEGDGG